MCGTLRAPPQTSNASRLSRLSMDGNRLQDAVGTRLASAMLRNVWLKVCKAIFQARRVIDRILASSFIHGRLHIAASYSVPTMEDCTFLPAIPSQPACALPHLFCPAGCCLNGCQSLSMRKCGLGYKTPVGFQAALAAGNLTLLFLTLDYNGIGLQSVRQEGIL